MDKTLFEKDQLKIRLNDNALDMFDLLICITVEAYKHDGLSTYDMAIGTQRIREAEELVSKIRGE